MASNKTCTQSGKKWGRRPFDEYDQCEGCGMMLPYNGGTVPTHKEAITLEETQESEWDRMVSGFGDRLSITVIGR